ncbi:MAG: F(420)H(2) dehydrogenase subunit A [Methanosaeta sp. PtaB.Bin039]|nr:MAG: F(420)H(2) dehydrogenase subunit A [Methanosaeta sp. PtaB.Bin039]OPY45213.1 MAG: F(420)H(2) dehydrogenase subunit A [Methanosaeta sp. PtaU1.Bin028]HQF16619.1 NADH-quinone oxidoreductase subunit A [Methanotrichaceae archaeon]HQI91251.1 NADH-quinone oxidoreductase subunit A [Methanotrichaceae archaeon]HQJ61701.1 NADH-quinone oxidoreductase subunit A [Methanothrix soehngenii]
MTGEPLAVEYYIPLIMFLVMGAIVPIAALAAVKIISPLKPNRRKKSIYEGGLSPVRDARIQFNVQYYLFAIVFVIFDVEVLFLYPWIYVYASEIMNRFVLLGFLNMAVVEMVLFIAVLLLGLLYAIKKEALRWV